MKKIKVKLEILLNSEHIFRDGKVNQLRQEDIDFSKKWWKKDSLIGLWVSIHSMYGGEERFELPPLMALEEAIILTKNQTFKIKKDDVVFKFKIISNSIIGKNLVDNERILI